MNYNVTLRGTLDFQDTISADSKEEAIGLAKEIVGVNPKPFITVTDATATHSFHESAENDIKQIFRTILPYPWKIFFSDGKFKVVFKDYDFISAEMDDERITKDKACEILGINKMTLEACLDAYDWNTISASHWFPSITELLTVQYSREKQKIRISTFYEQNFDSKDPMGDFHKIVVDSDDEQFQRLFRAFIEQSLDHGGDAKHLEGLANPQEFSSSALEEILNTGLYDSKDAFIMSVFANALYASSYWLDSYTAPVRSRNSAESSMLASLKVGKLSFTLQEDLDGQDTFFLDYNSLDRALETLRREYPDIYQSYIDDNADGGTDDVFLQIWMFGELIFG